MIDVGERRLRQRPQRLALDHQHLAAHDLLDPHAAIGRALAKANATLYLYDTAGAADIKAAAEAAGLKQPIHRLSSPKALAAALREALAADTACLLENRLPDIVRQAALA